MQDIFLLFKNFIFDLFFPRVCLGCGKEKTYLCEDCFSLLDISRCQFCPVCGKISIDGRTHLNCLRKSSLSGLYTAGSYQNKLIKKAITQFKYEPFLIKEMSRPLTDLIITHFSLLDKQPAFLTKDQDQYLIIPVPLHRKKLKRRGFNQSEEIAKKLSSALKIQIPKDVLFRGKETPAQVELKAEEREKNIRGIFFSKNQGAIKNKKILLVDDVYTTGATMDECARVLKEAGAKEIWGVAIAREPRE